MKKILGALALLVFANLAQAAVWPTENQWNAEWEGKYREWIKTHAHAKMFSNEKLANGQPNPYYGIRVDCADMVYSLRVLFSFENKLPFVMTNPVGSSGKVISNEITRYDSTAEGVPRLKKFLVWIYDLVSTNGLPKDTYSIGFKDVTGGVIILTSKKNHHSWTITDISKTGNPTLIFNSTVGRESGFDVQVRQSWPNPAWIFEAEVDKDDATKNIPIYKPGSYAGFRYWRPAQFLNVPESTVPGYNEEQHIVGVSKWKTIAQTSLAKVKENIDQVVMRLLKDACADLNQRVSAVEEAEVYKENMAADFAAGKSEADSSYVRDYMSDPERPSDRRCMTYKAFDQFSTPSRDKRFIDAIISARAYYKYGLEHFGEKSFSAANVAIYKAIFPFINNSAGEEAKLDKGDTSSDFCSVKIPNVGTLSLTRYKRRVFSGRFSSNPNDSHAVRFGYGKTVKDLGDVCPAYDLTKKSYDLNKIEEEMMAEVRTSPVAQAVAPK
jgi:hypothetical protein